MLRRRPLKVERERVARDRRAQRDSQIALPGLEHVLGRVRAVGEFVDTCTRAPLRVVEHGGERLPQRVAADAVVELLQAANANVAGRELSAQVGAALPGLAHLGGEAVDRSVVEHLRLDHDALVGERAAVGRHRPRGRAADVGVMGAVGGERDQLITGEHRGDHRDVGQMGAAAVRVVEDP